MPHDASLDQIDTSIEGANNPSVSKLKSRRKRVNNSHQELIRPPKPSNSTQMEGQSDTKSTAGCMIEICDSSDDDCPVCSNDGMQIAPVDDTCSFSPQSQNANRYHESAYVQNLAEISHDILNDIRWHVSGERLFRWEHGDDLNGLLHFSKFYPPIYR